jgi:hypothetical protein
MRRLKWLVFCFLVALVNQIALAQFTETKEITEMFEVSANTQIEITNKYGKIDIKTWDKDSVLFQINIRAEAKKLSKLEDVVREIDFDISNNEHYVIVRTIVEKNKSTLGREISRFKESFLKSDGSIQVDYSVWMPETNPLKIENKFGDIYMEDLYGRVDINLSNGNLKAHDFLGETTLTLSFSDANINTLKQGQLDCNFSEIYIKNASSLNLVSKSSDFEINQIETLELQSRRDKFRIREIDVFENKSSFSSFRIDELSDRLVFRSEYGSIDLEKTQMDFSTLLIESKSTDINLHFNPQSSFGFTFDLIDVETSFSDHVNITNEEVLDEKSNETKSEGYFGEKEIVDQKLKISANSGELSIRDE